MTKGLVRSTGVEADGRHRYWMYPDLLLKSTKGVDRSPARAHDYNSVFTGYSARSGAGTGAGPILTRTGSTNKSLFATLPQFKSIHQLSSTYKTFAMAAFAFSSCPETLSFGRSGYNKDGDNEDDKRCFGRSGYNKDGDNDDEKRCFGRSGYNKDGDDESDKGRSGYN
ncbi:hypothetical protein F5B18DRAFT_645842 [Nemania serpens]|nr:hypothetical protein F5B18DRAFT_645842 [Nemania serpens]